MPLRGMLDQAVEDGLIPRNPIAVINLSKIVPRDARRSDFKCNPFTMKEIAAILAACRDDERPLWQFAFATGLRTSELIAAETEQLDTSRFKLRIDRAKVEGMVEFYTKTKAGKRTIDLTQGAYDALVAAGVLPLQEGAASMPLFIDARYGKPWANDNALLKRWHRILKKAGVPYRNPYQTRHTFASTLLSSGENLLYVAKMMGHISLAMLNDHYAEWIEQGADEATRRASEAFFRKRSSVRGSAG